MLKHSEKTWYMPPDPDINEEELVWNPPPEKIKDKIKEIFIKLKYKIISKSPVIFKITLWFYKKLQKKNKKNINKN